ncbi:aspartic protease 7, partial [Aphelenchoides avenae]
MLRPLPCFLLNLLFILKLAEGASWPSETLRSYRDEAYAVDVKIGTPSQTYSLTIMIEAERIVVPAPSCRECCRKKAYDPTQSSTGACAPGTPFGWDGTGRDCNDTVAAFGRTLQNYDFRVVVNTSSANFFVRDGTWDGLFGLSAMTSFTDEPFGLFLQRTCTPEGAIATSAGTITYGGMDTNYCGEAFATLQLIDDPLSPDLSGSSGLTRLSQVQLGASDPIIDAHGGWKVNFETASSEIGVPRVSLGSSKSTMVPCLLQKVFDTLNKSWRATMNPKTGEWNVDCSIAGYLNLSFADAPQPLSIPVQQLVYRVEDSCVLRLRPWGPDDEFYTSSYWTFGLPLFRTYCSLYDFK